MSNYGTDIYDLIATGISKTADTAQTYITEDTKRIIAGSQTKPSGGSGDSGSGGAPWYSGNTGMILAGAGAIVLIGVVLAMRR